MRSVPRIPSRSKAYRLLGLLVAFAFALACEPALEPPPSEILGAWQTDAARYRDRSFEIRETALVFGTGKFAAPRLHILIGVERALPTAGWDVYRIRYREYDGTIAEIEIQHRPRPHDELRFANRPEVWTKSDPEESDDV